MVTEKPITQEQEEQNLKELEEKVKDQQKKEEEYAKNLERCIPIAKEVFKFLSENKIELGKLDNKKGDEIYSPIAKKMLELMLEKNVLYLERDLIFQLAMQGIEELRNRVVNSLQITWESMLKKFMDGKDITDVTLQDIETKIKNP